MVKRQPTQHQVAGPVFRQAGARAATVQQVGVCQGDQPGFAEIEQAARECGLQVRNLPVMKKIRC